MHYAVVEFGEFAGVPAVGGAYEVAGDALEFVDSCAVALTILSVFLIQDIRE